MLVGVIHLLVYSRLNFTLKRSCFGELGVFSRGVWSYIAVNLTFIHIERSTCLNISILFYELSFNFLLMSKHSIRNAFWVFSITCSVFYISVSFLSIGLILDTLHLFLTRWKRSSKWKNKNCAINPKMLREMNKNSLIEFFDQSNYKHKN